MWNRVCRSIFASMILDLWYQELSLANYLMNQLVAIEKKWLLQSLSDSDNWKTYAINAQKMMNFFSIRSFMQMISKIKKKRCYQIVMISITRNLTSDLMKAYELTERLEDSICSIYVHDFFLFYHPTRVRDLRSHNKKHQSSKHELRSSEDRICVDFQTILWFS